MHEVYIRIKLPYSTIWAKWGVGLLIHMLYGHVHLMWFRALFEVKPADMT